jgi:hypothetical protein
VLFYGSCLRRGVPEGVLDFYALVDDYRTAYASRLLAAANALFPPNVFYLELPDPRGTLRAKYAVLTLADFERAAGPGSLRPGVWARFCQPALAVYARDAAAEQALARGCASAVETALRRVVPLLPAEGGVVRFGARELFERVFCETYAAEMRPEAPEAVRGLVAADPARYERVTEVGLAALDGDAWRCESSSPEGRFAVRLDARVQRRARLAWRVRRPLAKLVYAAGLFKSATTFGDWLPYVLWKLERHSGTRIVPSERQRRHPFVWGWPLLYRALRSRSLR